MLRALHIALRTALHRTALCLLLIVLQCATASILVDDAAAHNALRFVSDDSLRMYKKFRSSCDLLARNSSAIERTAGGPAAAEAESEAEPVDRSEQTQQQYWLWEETAFVNALNSRLHDPAVPPSPLSTARPSASAAAAGDDSIVDSPFVARLAEPDSHLCAQLDENFDDSERQAEFRRLRQLRREKADELDLLMRTKKHGKIKLEDEIMGLLYEQTDVMKLDRYDRYQVFDLRRRKGKEVLDGFWCNNGTLENYDDDPDMFFIYRCHDDDRPNDG